MREKLMNYMPSNIPYVNKISFLCHSVRIASEFAFNSCRVNKYFKGTNK